MVNVWESFHFATLELVRSTPIKQRLVCAYRRHLAPIREESLPAEARDLFAQIIRSLTEIRPLKGEDSLTASVRKMSNLEADECASLVVEIFAILSTVPASGRAGTHTQLHAVDDSTEFEVPALLSKR